MRDLTIRRSLRGAIYTRVSSSSYKLIGPQWGKRFVIFEHLWAAEFVRLCLRGLLQRGELAFGQHQTFLSDLGFERLEPFLHRSSLAMRIWP